MCVFSFLQYNCPVSEVERIEIGEEVSYRYVRDVLRIAIEQWNHCIKDLRERFEDTAELLKLIESHNCDSEKDFEKTVAAVKEKLKETLVEVKIAETDNNFLTLAEYRFFFLGLALGYIRCSPACPPPPKGMG